MNDNSDLASLRRDGEKLDSELERRLEESRRRPARRARRPWSRGTKLFVLLAIVLLAGPALAVTLFTQTFPPTPAGVQATVTPTCLALTQNGPTSIVIGTGGTVLYTCGAPPSLTTNALTAIAGSATPTFTLPTAGTVSLSYVPHSSTATTCTAGTALVSTVSTTFAAGAYDYCLSYTSYPAAGIATFTVAWTQ